MTQTSTRRDALFHLAALAAAASPAAALAAGNDPYEQRDDVQAWARDTSARYQIDYEWVMDQMAQAHYQRLSAQRIQVVEGGRNWRSYRAGFLDTRRIRDGQRWWDDNARWLDAAERRWGVPAAIIVAIVGIETAYGRTPGNVRVLDALATLGFDFPTTGRKDRGPYFREELAAFLAWCHRENVRSCAEVRGSPAGAIGMPQFMPTSIERWAVDFNGDGRIDLQRSAADVIGSVANYLAQFGWVRNTVARYAVTRIESSQDELDEIVRRQRDQTKPVFAPDQLNAMGVILSSSARNYRGKLSLFELENGTYDPPLYVAGTQNFYTIMRYNNSAYYALAVIELAEALAR